MEQRLYFNHRLQKAIDKIIDYPLTIVSAPLAFGKRIAVEEAIRQAKEQGIHVEWFAIQEIQEQAYVDFVLEKLNTQTQEECFYVFEGCEGEEWIEELRMSRLNQTWQKNVHCILIMSSEIAMDVIHLTNWMHSISKEDLELKEKDIINLYQLYGIKINYQSASLLYEYSGGWPGAVMLGIREYFYEKKLVPGAGIDVLLEQEFLQKYQPSERDALYSLYGFKELSLEQILFLTGIKMEESYLLLAMIDENPFIDYDVVNEVYVIQDVLFHYLNRRIKKTSYLLQKRIKLRRAKWYEIQGQFKESIAIYQEFGEYESIYQYAYKLSTLCECVDTEFLEMLWNIHRKAPYYLKCKYIRFSLICVSLFFLHDEKRKGNRMLEEVEEIVVQVLELSERQKKELQGEISLVRALKYDRDLERIKRSYQVALELLEGPSMLYDNEFTYTEVVPSLLHRYYEKVGTLDQVVSNFRDCMKEFYKLTQYLNVGSTFILEAEAKLIRCKFEEAKQLAYCGIQLAEQYGQIGVKIIGQLLMAYIFWYLKKYKKMEEYIGYIQKESNKLTLKLQLQVKLSLLQFHIFLGHTTKIPEWITQNYFEELEHSESMNAYLNLCYLKQLLLKKQEKMIIDMSPYLFEQAYETGFLWVSIQVKTTEMIAYQRIGNEKEAIECLKTVIDLTKQDQIYLPFIRHYVELLPLFEKLIHDKFYQESIQKMMEIYDTMEQDCSEEPIEKQWEDDCYGLTKRELEIALLGAKRYSNKEIAKRLYISENTVKYNMKHIFQKLNIKSRLELKDFF